MDSAQHHTTQCPPLSTCPLSEIAIEIIQTLARIEESSKSIPMLDKRVTKLESFCDELRGEGKSRRRGTALFLTGVLAILSSGVEVWTVLHRESSALEQSVATLQTQTTAAVRRAETAEAIATDAKQSTKTQLADHSKRVAQLERENQVIYKTYQVVQPH